MLLHRLLPKNKISIIVVANLFYICSAQISADIYGNILIAALEAANNAILHGNKLDEKKFVEIKVRMDDKKLKITIDDEGNGFDYKNVPDPTAPENIENVNGRGIFLMEKLSDHITFARNGATVELEFNIK
jgi:serine/threonine-protein kinase RsbW